MSAGVQIHSVWDVLGLVVLVAIVGLLVWALLR